MPDSIAETAEYRVSPRVLPESWSGELFVSGEYAHTRLILGNEYRYSLTSMFFYATTERRKLPFTGTVRAAADGTLAIAFTPDITGEWLLTVESDDDKRRNVPFTIAIYVLPENLERFRPFVGDLHSHSTFSDGKQEPAYLPMRARTFGFDFFALTDHWCYESSRRMIREVGATLGSNMLLLTGEEMHPKREVVRGTDGVSPHYHHYHYVAIGHTGGVCDAFVAGGDRSLEEVDAIAAELRARGVDPNVDLLPYAEGVWKVRKAKELGALVVYAHPYWANPVNLDAGAIEQTFKDREVDAVEAISVGDNSAYVVNRLLQIAERSKRVPVVGVSDSHSWTESVPLHCCTLVMAERLDVRGILQAVRDGRSVACRMTEPLELVGPFELIDFASFYLHRILPVRRRITSLQGSLALSRLRGGAFSQEIIDSLDADLEDLDRSIWRRK